MRRTVIKIGMEISGGDTNEDWRRAPLNASRAGSDSDLRGLWIRTAEFLGILLSLIRLVHWKHEPQRLIISVDSTHRKTWSTCQ